jgi:hypothetical protein
MGAREAFMFPPRQTAGTQLNVTALWIDGGENMMVWGGERDFSSAEDTGQLVHSLTRFQEWATRNTAFTDVLYHGWQRFPLIDGCRHVSSTGNHGSARKEKECA